MPGNNERTRKLDRIDFLKDLDDPDGEHGEELERLVGDPDRVVSDTAREALHGPPLPNDSNDPNDVD